MKITRKWLESYNACEAGKEFFLSEGILSPKAGVLNLIKKHKLDWANWLIVRVLPQTKQIRYAIFAAEMVLDIFEKAYPTDKRPREAIAAAKNYIKNPTEKNKNAAYAAANAANAAYAAAYAAANAANAAYAAYAAANAANAAANAANAAYAANAANAANAAYAAANAANAANVANAAANAANVAANATLTMIVMFGLKLLRSSGRHV